MQAVSEEIQAIAIKWTEYTVLLYRARPRIIAASPKKETRWIDKDDDGTIVDDLGGMLGSLLSGR